MLASVVAMVATLVAVDYRQDLTELLDAFATYGAYVREDKVDFAALKARYEPKFAVAKDRSGVLRLVESVVGELHDFHATLGTNDGQSPRLVPSGADMVGHWLAGRAVLDEVRPGSLAEKAGVQAGDVVVEVSGEPSRKGCEAWLGVLRPDNRAWDWALNSALAGTWDKPRVLTLSRGGHWFSVNIPTASQADHKGVLTVEKRAGGILYLRPENSLGQNDLVSALDKSVDAMRAAKGIVLDLRNTPSGGNSNVARGMMGLFIGKRMPFQRHRAEERDTKTVRDWIEYVTPRLAKPVTAKLVVLVDHWTSSMGEGIAIGLDGMRRATVVGTPMAGLRGAVDRIELPVSKIPVSFPTEQVFHVNGTPRHLWKPPVVIDPASGRDAWWDKARSLLTSH